MLCLETDMSLFPRLCSFTTSGLFTKEHLSSQARGDEGLVNPDAVTLLGWRLAQHVVGQKVAGSPADVAKVNIGVSAIDGCLLALWFRWPSPLFSFVLMFSEDQGI